LLRGGANGCGGRPADGGERVGGQLPGDRSRQGFRHHALWVREQREHDGLFPSGANRVKLSRHVPRLAQMLLKEPWSSWCSSWCSVSSSCWCSFANKHRAPNGNDTEHQDEQELEHGKATDTN